MTQGIKRYMTLERDISDCYVTFSIHELNEETREWSVTRTLGAEYDVCDVEGACGLGFAKNQYQQYMVNCKMMIDLFFEEGIEETDDCDHSRVEHHLRLICLAMFANEYDRIRNF